MTTSSSGAQLRLGAEDIGEFSWTSILLVRVRIAFATASAASMRGVSCSGKMRGIAGNLVGGAVLVRAYLYPRH